MKKIAFFVEGQTEQIFLNRLVKEILGDKVSIMMKRSLGGTNVPKQELVRNAVILKDAFYQVLICDCGSDNKVKSEILENMENLKDRGYNYIIGLRDLYPLSEEQLPRLERGLKFLPAEYRKYHEPYTIVVAIQEVETWFLAETHHFKKVDNRLTGPFIHKYLRFNPFAIDPTTRKHPTQDLNNIYQLVGKSYTKRRWQVQKLVNHLDFDYLLKQVRYDVSSLNELIHAIEKFKGS